MPAKVAAAKAKADDIEARLHAGGDFAQLARSFSDGPTAAAGGDLGQYKRGALAKVLEDKTFALKAGQFTEPIRTRQGYVILKVTQHTPGGAQPLQRRAGAGGGGSLHEPDGAGDSRLSDQDARRGLHRHHAGLCRHRRQPQRDQADLQRLCAAFAQEEAEGGADPLSREHARLPQQVGRSFRRGRAGYRASRGNAGGYAERSTRRARTEDLAEKPGKKEKIRFGQAPRETLPTAAKDTEYRERRRAAGDGGERAGQSSGAYARDGENPLQRSRPHGEEDQEEGPGACGRPTTA